MEDETLDSPGLSGLNAPAAGNTVATLTPVDVHDAAMVNVPEIAAPAKQDVVEPAEDVYDVTRSEFTELQDAFLRLDARVSRFNTGSPHKI